MNEKTARTDTIIMAYAAVAASCKKAKKYETVRPDSVAVWP